LRFISFCCYLAYVCINIKIVTKIEETFVLTGLKQKERSHEIDRFPVLGYIPFLDYFFAHKHEVIKEIDLAITIIPRVVTL